jgi:penicillin-binding protein 1A
MKVALKDQPDLDFAVPVGMSLLPTGDGAIEAYKPGQTPGAQTNDSLLAGAASLESSATPAAQTVPGQPGAPAAPASTQPADIDKSLGGLY